MRQLNPLFFVSPQSDLETARKHAAQVDQTFGFKVAEIESVLLEKARGLNPDGTHHTWGHGLHQGNQTWVGLDPQTLQTPYDELVRMCNLLAPPGGSTIVDLGAGYGRMGLVLKVIYPEVNFLGFEYVPERVVEGNRILKEFECERSQLITQDLLAPDFKMPVADFYFLYDYGNVAHIRYTLKQLEDISEMKPIKVIARGKGVRSLIQYENTWLGGIYPAYHEEQFSIYSTY